MATDTKFVRGAARLAQRIRTIRANADLPVMTEELSQLILTRTLVSFDREEDPDGKKWQKVKESTLRRKSAKGFSTKTLQATGAMRNAIKIIRGQATGLISLTGTGARIGITDPARSKIGLFHNKGTKTNPQRRFLGVGALDVRAVDGYLRRRANKIMED